MTDPNLLDRFYTYGFGFTFLVAAVVYYVLMRSFAEEEEREPVAARATGK